jgi:pSer/pThr/pTyr-binding forkhead associated (FHA) protein
MKNGLKFLNGPQEGDVISVSVEKFIIGREPDCSLQLPRNLVSRHHCAIIQDGYTIRLRDLGSKNGTYVNGFKISREKQIKEGDIITVGGIALQFNLGCVVSDTSMEDTGTMSLSNTTIQDEQADITKIITPEENAKINAPHISQDNNVQPDLVTTGEEEGTDFDLETE